MEFEIDVLSYLRALVRRWWWIVAAAVAFGLLGVAYSLLQPVKYQAKASVFFRPSRSQLRLDDRFVTNEPIDTGARRVTLVALAHSMQVASVLPTEVRQQLGLSDDTVGDVLRQIDVSTNGDLLEIAASADSAEQAQLLANAWAEAFIAQVNQLYAQIPLPVSRERVEQVEAQYAAAQQAFEQFTGSNRISELDQRIAATQSVITGTLQADQRRYESYLARVNQLDLVLRDAEVLRGQLGDGSSVNLGDSIALLTLRSRLSGGSVSAGQQNQNPVELQIALPATIEAGAGVTLRDVNILIDTLQNNMEETRVAASELAMQLSDKGLSSQSSASEENRKTYTDQLLALMQQREIEEGKRLAIQQERDVSLTALQVVRSKAVEQEVAAVQPDVEVRMASEAMMPDSPVGSKTVLMIVSGVLSGSMIAVILIILLEAFGSIQSPPRPKSSADRNASYNATVEQI